MITNNHESNVISFQLFSFSTDIRTQSQSLRIKPAQTVSNPFQNSKYLLEFGVGINFQYQQSFLFLVIKIVLNFVLGLWDHPGFCMIISVYGQK